MGDYIWSSKDVNEPNREIHKRDPCHYWQHPPHRAERSYCSHKQQDSEDGPVNVQMSQTAPSVKDLNKEGPCLMILCHSSLSSTVLLPSLFRLSVGSRLLQGVE